MSRFFKVLTVVLSLASIGAPQSAFAATAAEILGWCDAASPERSEPLCIAYIEAIATIAAQPNRMADNYGVACFPQTPDDRRMLFLQRLAALALEKTDRGLVLTETNGFDAIGPVFIAAYPCR